ncbi:hypothetical protein ACF0H5_008736 [Mactra antiquata]
MRRLMGSLRQKIVATVSILAGIIIVYKWYRSLTKDRFTFIVGRTWDGKDIKHEKAEITVSSGDKDHVKIDITAPFYNDPVAPNGPPGQPFDQLWDYEVVEAFFLSSSGKYLEVEFCPHGQHLLLMLNGRRNMIKDKLAVQFTSNIENNRWSGTAMVPKEYFPPNVNKFNAYAIHGSGDNRVYEAYKPVPGDQPDFHRLEYFENVDFSQLLTQSSSTSNYWTAL